MTPSLPLLPTSVVGSSGLPGWVWLAREAIEAGRLGAFDHVFPLLHEVRAQ